jgi:hypothetical protein
MFGAPGNEEHVIKAVVKVVGEGVPIIGGSSADNKVLGEWRQISVGGSSAWGASKVGVTTAGVRCSFFDKHLYSSSAMGFAADAGMKPACM